MAVKHRVSLFATIFVTFSRNVTFTDANNTRERGGERLDDGGRRSRPATKDIKLKAEMALDGQLSRRIARK